MDYYRKALSPAVYRRALSCQYWAPCATLQELMDVAILAAHQEEAISVSHRPQSSSLLVPVTGVKVPHEAMAMDISAVASQSSFSSPRPETKFPFKFYRELCQSRGACWRFQKPYYDLHRSNKASGKPFCSNPQVSAADMDSYCVAHTTTPPPAAACMIASTLAAPVASPGVVAAVAPVPPVSLPPHSVYPPSYPAVYHYPPHMPAPLPSSAQYVPGPAFYPLVPSPLPSVPAPSPPANVSSISAVFSEYRSLDEPRYYDLPPSRVEELPSSPTAHSVSALTFTNPGSSDPRLIL